MDEFRELCESTIGIQQLIQVRKNFSFIRITFSDVSVIYETTCLLSKRIEGAVWGETS